MRNAHINSRKGTAAERKTNEIWFRKCGHGERLFSDYYSGQPGVVPADKWKEFDATLRTPLPVTFRLHGPTKGGGMICTYIYSVENASSNVSCGVKPASHAAHIHMPPLHVACKPGAPDGAEQAYALSLIRDEFVKDLAKLSPFVEPVVNAFVERYNMVCICFPSSM